MNDTSNDMKPTDADWVAFQYLSGELPPEAVARFEACLQDDQQAREALARAVEVTQVLAMIESPTSDVMACGTSGTSSRADAAWLAPVAWLAVAALACLAFLVFWNPGDPSPRLPRPNSNPGGQPVANHGVDPLDSGELASLWVNTAEFLVTTDLVSEGESFDGLIDDQLLEPAGASDDDVDRLQAPSWMMAALAASDSAETQE